MSHQGFVRHATDKDKISEWNATLSFMIICIYIYIIILLYIINNIIKN